MENNHLLYRINKLVCLLFCIWFAWPYANYKLGMYLGIGLSFVWIITSGKDFLLKMWSMDLIWIIIFFMTLVPYLFASSFRYSTFNTISILGTFYLFFLGMFIFHYYYFYCNDYCFLGKLAFITLIFYGIGSVQTLIGLTNYPEATRYLALGGLDPKVRQFYSNLGIGGFNFVYSSVFLLMVTMYFFIKKISMIDNKLKLIYLFNIIVLAFMIFKASYAIAIIMSLTAFLIFMLINNRRSFYLSLILFLLILILIPNHLISNIFNDLANNFSENAIIRSKLLDIARTVNRNQYDQTQLLNRLSLYKESFITFLKQPLFGVNGPFGNSNSDIGGHSGWIDIMAYFGLFTTLPIFIAIGLNFKKILNISREYRGIKIIQIYFIVFGIINPILYVYNIGLVVFLIVPAFPYIQLYIENRKRTMSNQLIGVKS